MTTRPNSRETLIDYSFRRLGSPVIDINVDYAQAEERLDDALEYFAERHFDGVERCIFSYQVQEEDITNKYIPTQNIGLAMGYTGAASPTGKDMLSVTRVYKFGALANQNMFDIRYQLALTDYFGVNRGLGYSSSLGLAGYDSTMRYIGMVEQFFNPEHVLHFSKVTDRLIMDAKLSSELSPGQFIVIEAYAALNPSDFPKIFNDRYLKEYVTALIKRQWGQNLSKFDGVQLTGGVTLRGGQLYQEALAEVAQLEQKMQSEYELPINFITG
tara:strand:- start:1971 stop:2783 length:813 start_codon:yes stop_codon:yes gene_type:complete